MTLKASVLRHKLFSAPVTLYSKRSAITVLPGGRLLLKSNDIRTTVN